MGFDMKTRFYLIQDHDGNIEIDIDVSDRPVDDMGNVSEYHAALAAIEQLGYILCVENG